MLIFTLEHCDMNLLEFLPSISLLLLLLTLEIFISMQSWLNCGSQLTNYSMTVCRGNTLVEFLFSSKFQDFICIWYHMLLLGIEMHVLCSSIVKVTKIFKPNFCNNFELDYVYYLPSRTGMSESRDI